MNIEAQKDEPTEYKILNRAIFYVSRLISSQKERDFVNTNYDDIISDDEIIGSLGLGIVRFNEVVTPEVIAADYEYRVDTDVVTTVTISGGQSDPDHPVSVTFSILGRNYTVNNVYYPEDGQQLVWMKT